MDPVGQAVISAAAPVVTSELMKDSAAASHSKKEKWTKWALICSVLYFTYRYLHRKP